MPPEAPKTELEQARERVSNLNQRLRDAKLAQERAVREADDKIKLESLRAEEERLLKEVQTVEAATERVLNPQAEEVPVVPTVASSPVAPVTSTPTTPTGEGK